MKSRNFKLAAWSLFGVWALTAHPVQAQAQVKASLENSETKSVEDLIEAVNKDLSNLTAHQDLQAAMGLENPALIALYQQWIHENPKNAHIPFALGNAYTNASSPLAKTYLLQAIAINPNYKEALAALWGDSGRWGDEALGRAYLKRIVELDPDDATYAFYYANSFKGIDEAKYKAMNLAVAKKFNTSERGAQALYWLAHNLTDIREKEAIYLQLKDNFSPADFNWSSSGMTSYNGLLLDEERYADSEALCTELYRLTEAESWSKNAEVSKQFVNFKALKAAGKTAEAIALLDGLKVPKYLAVYKKIPLLKADVQAQEGSDAKAFNTVLDFYKVSPSPALKTALFSYGKQLGKEQERVQADISTALREHAKEATAFELKNYEGGSNKLSDFKGKVTFITYWYPGCGPCRGEFPHFENVVRKSNKEQLAYIGINITSSQNDYVLPFLASSGYSFYPLEDVKGRAKGNLDNRNAAPVNFLIDKQGNLVFADFRTDAHNEDELELMIQEALAL